MNVAAAQVRGFDLGGIVCQGKLASLAVKFSLDDGSDQLTIWEPLLLYGLMDAVFAQASGCDEAATQAQLDDTACSAEREVIALRPTLVPADLSSPPDRVRVSSFRRQHDAYVLRLYLEFCGGEKKAISIDMGRCMVLFGYISNTISEIVGRPDWPAWASE